MAAAPSSEGQDPLIRAGGLERLADLTREGDAEGVCRPAGHIRSGRHQTGSLRRRAPKPAGHVAGPWPVGPETGT